MPNLFTMRFRRIDPNELVAAVQSRVQASAALDADAASAASAATMGAAQAIGGTSGSLQQAATASSTAAASGTQVVATPSSAIAPRRANDFWYAHIAQYRGAYLADGPTMRPNCGPASVTIALRLIGLDIPGFRGERSEAVLDRARVIATGRNDTTVGTTDAELKRLISASGARWEESRDLSQITRWVKQGIPVVLSGNPARGWDSRYSSSQVYPFDGGHWVTVSGYDASTGYYIVNDPLSQIGPIYVSESELSSYTRSHGNLGIAVHR